MHILKTSRWIKFKQKGFPSYLTFQDTVHVVRAFTRIRFWKILFGHQACNTMRYLRRIRKEKLSPYVSNQTDTLYLEAKKCTIFLHNIDNHIPLPSIADGVLEQEACEATSDHLFWFPRINFTQIRNKVF